MTQKTETFPDIDILDRRLRGLRLPGAAFTVTPSEAKFVANLSNWAAVEPSPIFSYIAALRGLGITLEHMCSLCDFELALGPIVGECRIQLQGEIQHSFKYRTDVVIFGIDRRPSTTYGIVDRLRFLVSLLEPGGASIADVQLTWLLPRGGA